MRLYSKHQHPKDWRFFIEDEGEAGFCLYVYEHAELFEMDLQSGEYGCPSHQQDYSQDTVAMAKKYAHGHFGVPLESWVEVKE